MQFVIWLQISAYTNFSWNGCWTSNIAKTKVVANPQNVTQVLYLTSHNPCLQGEELLDDQQPKQANKCILHSQGLCWLQTPKQAQISRLAIGFGGSPENAGCCFGHSLLTSSYWDAKNPSQWRTQWRIQDASQMSRLTLIALVDLRFGSIHDS